MSIAARGTFEVRLSPGGSELEGSVQRLDFTKTFKGDLEATGSGFLMSAGNPETGSAGYVAVEIVRGRLGGREGGFTFQQFGTMHAGSQTLHYEIVPGSGVRDLEGITGRLHLTIDDRGAHHYELDYDL